MQMADRETLELSLTENMQRQNLDPIEEAEAFRLYVVSFGIGGVTHLVQRIEKVGEYVSQTPASWPPERNKRSSQ